MKKSEISLWITNLAFHLSTLREWRESNLRCSINNANNHNRLELFLSRIAYNTHSSNHTGVLLEIIKIRFYKNVSQIKRGKIFNAAQFQK